MSNQSKDPKSTQQALKLSDTQLVLLSAASQRDDHCLMATPNLKGGAAQKIAERLIAAGLVREIKAKTGAPVWRRDEETAQFFALKLTAGGLTAIAVDDEAEEEEAEASYRSNARRNAAPPRDIADRARNRSKREGESGSEDSAASAPRPGSKAAGIIHLLQQAQGATIDDLMAATGWLPHTTRAALSGLKKRGYKIARSRSERITRYKIERRDRALNDLNGAQDGGASKTLRDEQAA
jgi:hypothetical protein